MNKKTPDLAESIQLAIDAAAAANDGTADLDRVRGQTEAAADRLDAFEKTLRPLSMGLIAGTVVAICLGGAVYLHALSRLSAAAATQEAAAAALAETVSALQVTLADFGDLDARLVDLTTARDIDDAVIRSALAAELIAAREAEAAEAQVTLPRVLSELRDATETEHADTRDFVASAASDLQLALTRLIADGPAPVAASAAGKAAQAASGSAPRTRARPVPAPRPAARRPDPNPFSFP
ncbi:MAG: hypothetical protein AAFP13_13055 [Pseudomonadota bacterium]